MKRRSEGGVLKSIKVKERSTAEKKMMEIKKSLGTYTNREARDHKVKVI